MTQSKKVIRREQCPVCLDSGKDNLAVYEDGKTWCFACNSNPTVMKKKLAPGLIDGEATELKTRGISKETCEFFDYQVGKYNEDWVQVANYKNKHGDVVAQKLRWATDDFGKKKMMIAGDASQMTLYGQWLYQPNPRLFVTIVEGEIDALTIAEVQGKQYPIVSVPAGAGSAYKAIADNLKWLMGFKYVVLAFDNDEVGLKAMQKCLALFDVDQVRIATWPLKDANEMLLAGRQNEIRTTLFNAKIVEPENIVTVHDILDEVLVQPQYGIEYPWPSLTELTYGFQLGELHVIVGANGIGKTEYIKELMFHFLNHDLKIGLFSFEQNPDNTIKRLVGSRLGSKLHLPGAEWNINTVRDEALKFDDKIYLCKKAGSANFQELFTSIRYLARAKNVKLFIIDNLKGLRIYNDHDRASELMTTLQALKKELNITILLLSHVAKDKYSYQAYVSTSPKTVDVQSVEDIEELVRKPGLEWETGRMPSKENVEGPSIVCDLADYVFGLARNTTSNDPEEAKTLRVKVLKSRLDSRFTGKVFKLYYTDSGTYKELTGDF